MNLSDGAVTLRTSLFQVGSFLRQLLPARRIEAFGGGDKKIGQILVINLDRQSGRWRRMVRELNRFNTSDGQPLANIAKRLSAVDARDPRETAPTADVDPIYTMRDQLFVQPDARLEECFGLEERIRMTRQEIAVARSHVEAWKCIATGPHHHVLVLEDDVYFVRGAASLIERGWREALIRTSGDGGALLYLSYLDAGGTAEKCDVGLHLFRPVRGFWYLSGYVLSRVGATTLLRSMPVVGPVDLWVNHQFVVLKPFALPLALR